MKLSDAQFSAGQKNLMLGVFAAPLAIGLGTKVVTADDEKLRTIRLGTMGAGVMSTLYGLASGQKTAVGVGFALVGAAAVMRIFRDRQ